MSSSFHFRIASRTNRGNLNSSSNELRPKRKLIVEDSPYNHFVSSDGVNPPKFFSNWVRSVTSRGVLTRFVLPTLEHHVSWFNSIVTIMFVHPHQFIILSEINDRNLFYIEPINEGKIILQLLFIPTCVISVKEIPYNDQIIIILLGQNFKLRLIWEPIIFLDSDLIPIPNLPTATSNNDLYRTM
jgi:hypothetical protein